MKLRNKKTGEIYEMFSEGGKQRAFGNSVIPERTNPTAQTSISL